MLPRVFGTKSLIGFVLQKRQPQKRQPQKTKSLRDLLLFDLTPGEYELPRDGLPIVTMRCVCCGSLESFARPKSVPEQQEQKER